MYKVLFETLNCFVVTWVHYTTLYQYCGSFVASFFNYDTLNFTLMCHSLPLLSRA